MKCVHVVALAIEAVAAATSHICLKVMLPQRCGGGARPRQRRHCVQASQITGTAAERVQRVHLYPSKFGNG